MPTDCAYSQTFVCESYDPLSNCRCDLSAPKYMSDCAQPLDFQCRVIEVAGQARYVACRCETPELTPDDCPIPETFHCRIDYPLLSDCDCNGMVIDETACEPGYGLCCQSYEPRFGCECCSLVIK